MLDVTGEQIAKIERFDPAAHQRDRIVRDTEGSVHVVVRCRGRHEIRQHLDTSIGAHLDDEPVLLANELGEGQIESALRARARAHRGAEARAARHAAVDGDEERAFTTRRVLAIDERSLEEDPVLDGDRVEIAGANPEKRERPLGGRLLDELRPPSSSRRACQRRIRAGSNHRFHDCGPTG